MFLENENFPRPSTILLREHGYIIKSIQEDFPGISDDEVIKIAIELNLILLTLTVIMVSLYSSIQIKNLLLLCF
ncbi:DUF5615 family PIN-like protein [Parasediminibacterium sp. JCM 36343]|uniref:DUF5615 family PIN-like protein n=1 Tax=Parasediminibacterium sp. JCM 36343 TaxID=3374279 RepID=UPI003979053A